MTNSNNTYLFKSILNNTYQRDRYPHLIKVIPIEKCFKDLDLLTKSIVYSVIVPYYDRVDYYWPIIRRCLCNGNTKEIYISLVFNKPTCLEGLRVTYISDIKELNLFPFLRDKVLNDLLEIAKR